MRFTAFAEKVIDRSKAVSARLGCPFTGTEHLLLAILSEPECAACKLLAARGVTYQVVDRMIPEMSGGSDVSDGVFSVRLRHVIEYASLQADRRGGEIGTEHLLQALSSEDGCTAVKLLSQAGVKPAEIYADAASVINLRPVKHSAAREDGYLRKYGTDLCEAYRRGRLDPCIGRERECDALIDVLCRRTKNAPILLGEAGVGKTAIVEGAAKMLAEDLVPAALRGKTIISVDVASVVSGAKYRGDFEERFRGLINEAISRGDAILFFDEIHTLVGAGAAEGAIDASDMMKVPLGRGMISVIGATTFGEYEKYIEPDPALSRRFTPIPVAEPDNELARRMIEGVRTVYEKHHGVTITSSAIEAAVGLSRRFIKNRYLPDKALDLIDDASCAVSKTGSGTVVTAADVEVALRRRCGGTAVFPASDELRAKLGERILGQKKALDGICAALSRKSAGFCRERGPFASFLFTGPTGSGKTECCRALAETLGRPLLRFDMSEYSEHHSIARLIGSPPGYVGHDDGGQLTRAVFRQPFAVVCLDEADKAHPDILGILLQILEEGELTDGRGRKADMSAAIVILTSNEGSANSAGFIPSQKSADRFFGRELVNRFDSVIGFDRLDDEALRGIIRCRIAALGDVCGIPVEADEDVISAIAESCDKKYGGRGALRAVAELVEAPLASIINISGTERVLLWLCGKDIEVTAVKGLDRSAFLEYNLKNDTAERTDIKNGSNETVCYRRRARLRQRDRGVLL